MDQPPPPYPGGPADAAYPPGEKGAPPGSEMPPGMGPPPPAGYAPPPGAYPPPGGPLPPGAYPPPQGGVYPPPPGQPVYPAQPYGQGFGPAQPGYGPGYPAPPLGQPGGPTVVVAQPEVTTLVQHFREAPVQTMCPQCGAQIVTGTTYEAGTFTWLVCALLCLVGCDGGCCLIPFCVDSCKDVVHHCPNCQRPVSRYNRL